MKRITALSTELLLGIAASCTQSNSPSFPSFSQPEPSGYLSAHYWSSAENRQVDTEISLPKDSLPVREGFFYYGCDIHAGPVRFEGIEFTDARDSLGAGNELFGALEGTGLVGLMTTTTRDINNIRDSQKHELDGEFEGHRWDRKETVSISFSIGY